MDALFTIKNNYLVDNSKDNVASELAGILDRRWYDFSENVSGQINPDGSFKISPKWALGYIKVLGMSQQFSYLIGKLKEENNQTRIEISTRPNYTLVVAFYFLPLLLLLKLFGFNILPEMTMGQLLLTVMVICVALAIIMITGVYMLRNRFERLMQLNSKDK